MAFFVGQKVVCVKQGEWRDSVSGLEISDRGYSLPINGRTYTVRGFFGADHIWLEEIINRPRRYSNGTHERAFATCRFHPVTDISDLIQIANEVKTGKPRDIAPDRFDRKPAPVKIRQGLIGRYDAIAYPGQRRA